jgi:hypothetical protein
MDAGSHHFSAGYRLFALVSTGVWVAVLLLRAVHLRIAFGREEPSQSPELGNERRSLGRKPVVVGVTIAALWIAIMVVEVIRLSI